jgi:hypothetical protein
MTTPRHLGKLSWLILTAGTVAVVAVGAFWIVEARRAVAEAIEDMDSGFEFTVRPIPQAALADIEYLSAPPGYLAGHAISKII